MIDSRIAGLVSAVLLVAVSIGLPRPAAADEATAAPGPSQMVLDPEGAGDGTPSADLLRRITPSSQQVSAAVSKDPAAPGIVVTIQPGPDGYPGITLKPEGPAWDLSAFGRVDARVVNTSKKAISVCLRIDDDGDWQKNSWNAEQVYLQPGAAGTALVRFGYSWGKPGYPLKPASVVKMLLFTGKTDEPLSFRVEWIRAGGKPGEVDPKSVRLQPKDGLLLGTGITLNAAEQISNQQGAQGTLFTQDGQQLLKVVLPAAAKGEPSVVLKPAQGRWNLRDYLEVRVQVRNAGQSPLRPRLRVESDAGPSDWIDADAPLPPGTVREIVIPFASATPWNGKQKDKDQRFVSDAISGVTISAATDDANATADHMLIVDRVQAVVPPAPPLPDGLGQRPPVDGDWVQTFADEFDAPAIDLSKWNIYGENYWDSLSHFSKANTIIGDGVVRLRFSRNPGHQNDDPNHKRKTDYATGFLDTYGKFTQRYGYFEARMKLPRAPGLWPAFWMMPDRGAERGPQWVRQDTGNGGMEFDIMEHLTRWGPYRYNIAMHWDGYGKDHKSIGTDRIYAQPDADGFITAGLLWTPGSLVYYCNGREVARWDDPRICSVPANLIFTLPTGGWDNDALDDSRLPDDFVIDWVRVWQRRDLTAGKSE